MSIFARIVGGVAELGKIGAQAAAMQQRQAQYERDAKRAARKGEAAPTPAEGCTPCAAKARGAEMANDIWRDNPIWK